MISPPEGRSSGLLPWPRAPSFPARMFLSLWPPGPGHSFPSSSHQVYLYANQPQRGNHNDGKLCWEIPWIFLWHIPSVSVVTWLKIWIRVGIWGPPRPPARGEKTSNKSKIKPVEKSGSVSCLYKLIYKLLNTKLHWKSKKWLCKHLRISFLLHCIPISLHAWVYFHPADWWSEIGTPVCLLAIGRRCCAFLIGNWSNWARRGARIVNWKQSRVTVSVKYFSLHIWAQ